MNINEKQKYQKRLDSFASKEELKEHLELLPLEEVKNYAMVMNTPTYSMYFKKYENDLEFSHKEIIEDINNILFGD